MDSSHESGEVGEMANQQIEAGSIQEVRRALMAAGYMFAGYGALTKAETYKRDDGRVVFIRRRNGLVVAA